MPLEKKSFTKISHPLEAVFSEAIAQATHGKGMRHGGNTTPFMEQPWVHYAKLHGRGFLTGQAAKKLEEAASTREGEAFINEVYGAMVYLGMAVIHETMVMQDNGEVHRIATHIANFLHQDGYDANAR